MTPPDGQIGGRAVSPAGGPGAEILAFTPRPPRPTHRLPSCHGLLDGRIRNGLWTYRMLGFVGVCISEATAYIELLEDELARREQEDRP
jgi:hypothetical protein